jgi:hypothetical protein
LLYHLLKVGVKTVHAWMSVSFEIAHTPKFLVESSAVNAHLTAQGYDAGFDQASLERFCGAPTRSV